MSLQYLQAARKIVCIGRNYHAHIKELNNATPQLPFFFLKPTTSLLAPGAGAIQLPKGVTTHHEIELAVILNRDLVNLPDSFSSQDALNAISGYALAIDLTARNVQDEAKKKGLPWSIGKGFDTYCPMSPFIPKEAIEDPYKLTIWLKVNGQTRQNDSTGLMITKIDEILRTMSRVMTLQKGDIILTGTPQGVSTLEVGDKVECGLEDESGVPVPNGEIHVGCVAKEGPYVYRET
ncbi:hypothetical protein BABINDRAFT_163929 [Babjeviella inositovora NRRL Y-12698]|uniref:Fumarylacetoacetase-like C-terminal domain-containing protein n=1 Tax=Babjeviella inositovora NRRL Y-12698 TaxID=984486 RepID=A0A1E3QGU5_9ASCO|nr:uncharacterized protein BABINDRAFT_163929 [Babjeviella inositovora NRRL Y-12698]ODQ76923.1 hypothetical protein BABINDRAFT_163929 [Babjeviella inositovora NRRL Y-12698]